MITRLSMLLILLGNAATAHAEVVGFDIERREDVLEGKSFGASGAYEKLVGTVRFAVDPTSSANSQVVDLDRAPKDENGRVLFSADVYVLQPKNPALGNGSLLLEIPNRGGKAMTQMFQGGARSLDPTKPAHFGDAFLLRRGFTLVWLGWQFDVRDDPGLLALDAPKLPGLTGLVRSDFVLPERREFHGLGHLIAGRIGGREYPVAEPNHPRTTLTVRTRRDGKRETIPQSSWSWVERDGSITGVRYPKGFKPGRIYELIYSATDATVVGAGLMAVRDFASFTKRKSGPVVADRVIAFGHSQSGRFLRHFLYQGFNVDERGAKALDGVFSNAAGAGRGSFNHRFAQPSRDAQPMEAVFYPTDVYPFADTALQDPRTRKTEGLLDRAGSLPKIIYSNTSYEYWGRAGSLIHTTPDGRKDVPLREEVRIYHLAGLQHFQRGFPPEKMNVRHIRGQHVINPNPSRWTLRALLIGLHEWVSDVAEPPESAYPKLSDKTLVPLKEALRGFPKLPKVRLPKDVHRAYRVNYGAQWPNGLITNHPPIVGQPYVSLVPAVDEDGNDRGGIRIPQLEAPLATYTPWNLRDPSIGSPSSRVSFLGSFFPLPKKKSPRDPRRPIDARYRSRDEYLGRYTEAALALVEKGYLLDEDLPAVLKRGLDEWNFVVGTQ